MVIAGLRYRWANRPCKLARASSREGLRLVAMRLDKVRLVLLALLVLAPRSGLVRRRTRAAAADRAAGRAAGGAAMRRGCLLGGRGAGADLDAGARARRNRCCPTCFDNPAPAPAPAPAAAPRHRARRRRPSGASAPVVQPLPGRRTGRRLDVEVTLPADFPSLAELEAMDAGRGRRAARAQAQVRHSARRAPRGARDRRARRRRGRLSRRLARRPAAAADPRRARRQPRPLVSRWGHILLRRALASRLDAPRGMDPVDVRRAARRAAQPHRRGHGRARAGAGRRFGELQHRARERRVRRLPRRPATSSACARSRGSRARCARTASGT